MYNNQTVAILAYGTDRWFNVVGQFREDENVMLKKIECSQIFSAVEKKLAMTKRPVTKRSILKLSETRK